MEEQETDKTKTGKWNCKLCTYKNLLSQLKCELCGTARDSGRGSESDAIKAQADMLSRQWSCKICTFDNIQGATKCAKCDAEKDSSIQKSIPQITKPAVRCDSPKIESTSCSKIPQIMPKSNDVVSYHDDGDLIATSSSYKWKCQTCTYLNFAAAINCTMCRSPCHLPSKKTGLNPCLPKELYKPVVPTPSIIQDNRLFMIFGSLSRYMNYFTGLSNHEDLFFRAVGSIISKHAHAIDVVINYLVNDGNVHRALNHFEAIIVYDYSVNMPVMCGDTLLSLARRCGLTEIQKLLERVSLPEDNLPCAAAAPNSELYSRINHIFHFCRPPYKIPFRAYNFNIFKLPFPKTDLTNHLVSEIFQSNFDPLMKQQSLVRYVQVSQNIGQDIRHSTVLGCPSTLVIRNRGGQHSLFDAIMQSMFGVCDRSNLLRDQLQNHLNSNSDLYKPLFIRQYKMMASQIGIQIGIQELEEIWLNCVNNTSKQSYQIEPIYVFALSHIISRPIIILPFSSPVELSKRPRNLQSLANSRTNSYHFFEGFYVPYFSKSELSTRSPICLLHSNANFYSWMTNDEFIENCQNFIIVNYPRNQLGQMFRFLDDCDEKQLRCFMNLIQLTPNSVAIHHANQDETLPEVISYYFDYLCASERSFKINRSMKAIDVLRQMSTNLPSNPNNHIIKLFSQRAKRVLSRRPLNYETDNAEDEYFELENETATKMAKHELKK